jgi:hypothetical protein
MAQNLSSDRRSVDDRWTIEKVVRARKGGGGNRNSADKKALVVIEDSVAKTHRGCRLQHNY